jgi:exosortase C (VPDSG-CTERM-specific)
MNSPMERQASDLPSKHRDDAPIAGRTGFLIASLVLSACFALPLVHLARFALSHDLYSHILLIPFISYYLYWERRKTLPVGSSPDKAGASFFAILGLAFLVGFIVARMNGAGLAPEDTLAIEISAYLLLFTAICLVFLGRPVVRALAFPLAFLVFMVPFPGFLLDAIVGGLQVASAKAAHVMFVLAGTPVVFDSLIIRLSDITLEVAPECSGIHSSLALLVTSVVAAFLFVRKPWKRALLILAVVPLAIIRNGFRIFTIGELCVHIGPQMIDSNIHRHGGPIFFALSLVPFFALLLLLSKGDRRRREQPGPIPARK